MRKSLLFLSLALALGANAGQWGSRGVSRRFIMRGELLYAADGRGVSVYDTRLTPPRRIDVEGGYDETRDLAFAGNTVIVATRRGLDRFDVDAAGTLTRATSSSDIRDITNIAGSDRFIAAASDTGVALLDLSLTRVRQFRFGNSVRAVTFIDGVLYVAVTDNGVFAEDPESGEELAFLPVDAADFSLAGSILWAAGSGLTSINVANPREPSVLGRTGSGVLKLATVSASGSRVYAAERPDRIDVFDAANPASPRLIATVRDWVQTLAAGGARLYTAGRIFDSDGMPYETGIPVRVWNETADGIRLAADVADLAGPVSGAWTDGSIAVIVDAPYLRVLDVSNTEQPRELASIEIAGIQDHIRVRNGLAILYGRHAVQFVDVSNPYQPTLRGTWDTQGHPPSVAAFLRDTVIEANEHSGMHVLDYSDPSNPHLAASRRWHYHDIVAGDDAAYAMELGYFLTVDVSDRTRIVDRDSRAVDGYPQMETIPPSSPAPRFLFWRGVDHVALLTLEDRFNPRQIARVPVANPELIGASETSGYVASGGALWRFDASSPVDLAETGMRVTAPQQIAVAGGKVVIADRYSVRVYGPDTTPPPLPPARATKRRATRH